MNADSAFPNITSPNVTTKAFMNSVVSNEWAPAAVEAGRLAWEKEAAKLSWAIGMTPLQVPLKVQKSFTVRSPALIKLKEEAERRAVASGWTCARVYARHPNNAHWACSCTPCMHAIRPCCPSHAGAMTCAETHMLSLTSKP